jgi:hypothetical protein
MAPAMDVVQARDVMMMKVVDVADEDESSLH